MVCSFGIISFASFNFLTDLLHILTQTLSVAHTHMTIIKVKGKKRVEGKIGLQEEFSFKTTFLLKIEKYIKFPLKYCLLYGTVAEE